MSFQQLFGGAPISPTANNPLRVLEEESRLNSILMLRNCVGERLTLEVALSQQTHDVVSTSIRRLYNVAAVVQTFYRRCNDVVCLLGSYGYCKLVIAPSFCCKVLLQCVLTKMAAQVNFSLLVVDSIVFVKVLLMEKYMSLDSMRERARKCDRENRDWRCRQIRPS